MAIKLSGMISGLDTYSMIEELTKAYSVKKDNIVKEQKALEYTKNAWSDLNYKIYGFFSGKLSNMRFTDNLVTKKATISDTSKATVSGTNKAVSGMQELEINSLAKAGYLTGEKLSNNNEYTSKTKLSALGINEGTINVSTKDKSVNIDITKDMTINEFATALSNAGVNASFDEKNQRFFVSSKETGKDYDFSLAGTTSTGSMALDKLGLFVTSISEASYYNDFLNSEADKNSEAYKYAQEMVDAYNEYNELVENNSSDKERIAELSKKLGLDSTDSSRIEGSDAKIKLNSVSFESNTNNFEINGLSINATGLTKENEPLQITTSTDTDKMFDMVVGFIEEYNNLIKEMDTAYNAPDSKYKPLTDEEMEALSDSQAKKWDEKLKESALRKDSTLYSVINTMKSAMGASYSVNGEELSLASFGIVKGNYFQTGSNERGMYELDDEAKTKLKEAISSDPEKFTEFFSKLSKNVYDKLNSRMRSTSMNSAYTIYNDKLMKQKNEEYEKKIAKEEEKIAKMTEKYEQQFAAMETMLAQLQSNMSAMSSLFGGFN